ncbi:rhodanese-like domain-containing protein [Corallibacter sp.]|uniref:rhodanese-like domain-containing protein n=1 Tax=Corallibacter sp. TaxID=2038084 RepID=UPI003AB3B928
MRHLCFYIAFLILSAQIANAQESLSELLQRYNTKKISYITAKELAMPKTEAIILDAREFKEYKVSHLKKAIHIGYSNFKKNILQEKNIQKEQLIVVYCSIGIRSEHIALKLKKMGYTNVYNLYGGIFEWKNNELSVYDIKNQETENVHTFSKQWSKWLKTGNKIY